jgi:tetratricopeptide (TPR) repeat protein
MADDHVPEALEVFKLNTTLYPESANTYDSLGESYERSGQKTLAIQFYEKSPQMNPDNQNGKENLKKLKSTEPRL